ncbi:hypothetical protein ACWF95_37270 [Streptomyces vinaceus]
MWVLFGMVGELQDRVTHLTEDRDRLGRGSADAERKLTRALGQQNRAASELARARAKQREAEELAARLQEKIDRLTGELDRLRPGTGPQPEPAVGPAPDPAGGDDPEGDDIEAAITLMTRRITRRQSRRAGQPASREHTRD